MRTKELRKKRKIQSLGLTGLAGLLLVGIVFLSAPVYAYTLNNWNVTELNAGGDYVTVTAGTNSSGDATLTVQWFGGGLPGAPTGIGIDMFGYDDGDLDFSDAASVAGISGNDSDWTPFNFDGTQYDGFGSFDSHKNLGPAETGGISAPLVFTLSGSTSGYQPTQFVAHVRYSNNCSGFVTNRTGASTGLESNSNCGAQVPEPSSLFLLGSGFVALGLWGRKRLKAIS